MKCIVCVKQVPDTANVEVDPVTGVLKRDGTRQVADMNEETLERERKKFTRFLEK